MADFDEGGGYSLDSSATRLACEDCGYKWRVEGASEDVDEDDGTVYYDAASDFQGAACPMCGCKNVVPL